jgi:hypothetical protein
MPRHQITPEERAKWPRRRCDNCGNFYHRNPERPDHRFCKSKCRIEFSRNGSPLIRLREKIHKETDQAAAEHMATMRAELAKLRAELAELRSRVRMLEQP